MVDWLVDDNETRVETGWNTSTVALRVVNGDKREPGFK
jgi:hypothetical protein